MSGTIYDFIRVGEQDLEDQRDSFLDTPIADLNNLLVRPELLVRAVTLTFDPKKHYKPHQMAYRSLDHFVRNDLRKRFCRFKKFGYQLFSELGEDNLLYHLHGVVVGSPLQVGLFIKYCHKQYGHIEVKLAGTMRDWYDYSTSKGQWKYKAKFKTGFRTIIFVGQA